MPAFFEDLFPFARSLCHLRAYGVDNGLIVALAVDLEDNPGASVVNAANALRDRIEVVFGGDCRLFCIFPQYKDTWTEVLPPVDDGGATFRTGVTQAEIERLVGVPIKVPTPSECGALDLGGEGHPLLVLIPDEEDEPGVVAEMEAVAVAGLPWAHLPSKCAHFQDFEAIRTLYDESREGEVPTGAHFFLGLSSERLAACHYHRNDWKAIAAASVELFKRLGPHADDDDVRREAACLLPEGSDRNELIFLFFDPIIWSPGAPSITNGQHRTCALKAAGAPECVVVTGRRLQGEVRPGNPRRRAESALAEYWARRLGHAHDKGGRDTTSAVS
jgi:hypothetical protein